ncbi:hypothetical protein BCR34DRAFT_131970 [Clohesyomyces aquaticus]|uniref:Uncharacterized protein n=1 Tax=Clohesyomyces aquaticus TaxID=1231657 RepID=A0A1Y2AAF6_9PLEO|nr:hypothetical protein BCR34DRAFT_131970 [Clohesyomyces aquaticus]
MRLRIETRKNHFTTYLLHTTLLREYRSGKENDSTPKRLNTYKRESIRRNSIPRPFCRRNKLCNCRNPEGVAAGSSRGTQTPPGTCICQAKTLENRPIRPIEEGKEGRHMFAARERSGVLLVKSRPTQGYHKETRVGKPLNRTISMASAQARKTFSQRRG